MDETTPIAPKDKARGGSDSQAVYYGEGQSPGQVWLYAININQISWFNYHMRTHRKCNFAIHRFVVIFVIGNSILGKKCGLWIERKFMWGLNIVLCNLYFMFFFLENDPAWMYSVCHPSRAGKQMQKYINHYLSLWNPSHTSLYDLKQM